MLLLVGLGNPGGGYAGNRHNIGFMGLDAIHRRHGFSPWRSRFQGLSAEGQLAGVKTILLKPETYMNESGRSVGEAMRFLKIPLEDVVVLHDELDLKPGEVRVKTGGGNAGHNGLRSITALCGNEYRRVRLGIGHPGDKSLVHAYVLSNFFKEERGWVEGLAGLVAAEAERLASKDDGGFQSAVNRAMADAGLVAQAASSRAAKG